MVTAGVMLSDTHVEAIKNNTASTWPTWDAKSSSRVVRTRRALTGNRGGRYFSLQPS